MALIDVDRHILTELVVLQEKMRSGALAFRIAWDEITDVKIRTEVIVLDNKDADNPALPELRDRISRAIKVCNTKMLVMDDAMSKQHALLKHLVSTVKLADTGKGSERGNNMD